MPVLYLRIPDDLDRALRDLAAADRRSISAEAIVLLEGAIKAAKGNQE